MIKIDVRKLNVKANINTTVNECEDGSVQIVRYNPVAVPDDLLELDVSRYWGKEHYQINVNLPEQRKVILLVAVLRSSVNRWQVTVSSLKGSFVMAYKTLNEVNELLKGLFV